MSVFACDGANDDNENGGLIPTLSIQNNYAFIGHMQVPTCGEGMLNSEGELNTDAPLSVNWTGPDAPTEPCNEPGFGDGEPRPINAYSWAMASFGDHIYVGLMNRMGTAQAGEITEGAEIWRYKPGATVNSGVWTPEIAGGFNNTNNNGIRSMAVYNDQLFAGTFNFEQGAQLWRRNPDSPDGKGEWEIVDDSGFDHDRNSSVRSMAVFNGKLYMGTQNGKGARLYRYNAATQAVTQVKGGDNVSVIRNTDSVVSEMVPFGDYLWIFTWGSSFTAYRMDRNENIQVAKVVVVDHPPQVYRSGLRNPPGEKWSCLKY